MTGTFLMLTPSSALPFLVVMFLGALAIIAYALHKKGDVRAVISHGRTVFELEAKEPHIRAEETKKPVLHG